jgi:DNA-binding PadR family transcriptional regulator
MSASKTRASTSDLSSGRSKFQRRRAEDRAIGPLAYLVLCAVEDLQKSQAFGTAIAERMSEYLDEFVDQAQVYVALRRLAEKHYVIGSEIKSQGRGHSVLTVYRLSESGRAQKNDAAKFYAKIASVQLRR